MLQDPNALQILKKDIMTFEDLNKEAKQDRQHIQRINPDPSPDPTTQIDLIMERINKLDGLVTLRDKFVEKKVGLETKIKEIEAKLEDTVKSGTKSTDDARKEKDDLKVGVWGVNNVDNLVFRFSSTMQPLKLVLTSMTSVPWLTC